MPLSLGVIMVESCDAVPRHRGRHRIATRKIGTWYRYVPTCGNTDAVTYSKLSCLVPVVDGIGFFYDGPSDAWSGPYRPIDNRVLDGSCYNPPAPTFLWAYHTFSFVVLRYQNTTTTKKIPLASHRLR